MARLARIILPVLLYDGESCTFPKYVLEFINQYGRVIYKSMSGVRSIVKSITHDGLERLNDICWCLTQFLQYIEGIDVRVHTVGKKFFATGIESDRIDYRYPENSGDASPIMSAFDLDDVTAGKCLNLAQSLGLNLSGIDLKITEGCSSILPGNKSLSRFQPF